MSRRIDIELTSSRDDGSWTWRAAGARQPKGVLDGNLLPEGAATGDQLRADVETTLDGTDVLSVAPPKEKKRPPVDTIELIARGPSDDQLVITTLAPKRGRGDRRDRGDRRNGDRGDRGSRRDGDRQKRGDRPGGDRGERPGSERRERSDRSRTARDGEQTGPGGRSRRDRPASSAPPARPKAKRLRPARTHRKAALGALAPEEQVIAEQLLRGGVPAVRQAVDKQNEQAKVEGRPTVKPEPLLAVADKLLPALRAAEWRDRAEAAIVDLEELDLRDLRSVVVAADTGTKDDESRALAAQLREGLSRRVEQEQIAWLAEMAETLAAGRVVRALRLSSRPPKAGSPLPADLAARLADTASAALSADTADDRWATVLDALSFSPARLTVVPTSKPDTPSKDLIAAVTRVAARVPKVAEAFGIDAPAEEPRRRSRSKSGRKGGARGPKDPKGSKPAASGEGGGPASEQAATNERFAEAASEQTPPAGGTPTPGTQEAATPPSGPETPPDTPAAAAEPLPETPEAGEQAAPPAAPGSSDA